MTDLRFPRDIVLSIRFGILAIGLFKFTEEIVPGFLRRLLWFAPEDEGEAAVGPTFPREPSRRRLMDGPFTFDQVRRPRGL